MQDIGLVLNSSNDKEIWNTSAGGPKLSSSHGIDTLQLEDQGFLSIMSNSNSSLWSSHDYPADTLIRGQHLNTSTSMAAAQFDQEHSTGGIFYLQVDGARFTLAQDFKLSGTPHFIYGSSRNATQNISYLAVENGFSAFKSDNIGQNHTLLFSDANGTNWDYARLESNGSLMLKTYNPGQPREQPRELVELLGAGNCVIPGKCGSFGECLPNGTCTCPDGFQEAKMSADFTCRRIQALNTTMMDCSSDSKLVNVTGQTYLSVSNVSTANDVNVTSCEDRCHRNCTCTSALHVRRNASSPEGPCFINLDSVQTIQQSLGNGDPLQMLFLRIASVNIIFPSPPPSTPGGSGKSSRRTAASAFAGGAGALVLVLLAMSAWWLVYTRRKYFDEAERGAYDSAMVGASPSQLPPQYTYKQLVESTSNFAQRLGYGGLGLSSVYAGSLPVTNAKIAVKNLDDNGYKDREFLAAVATMGSLSHAHLVPLLGFCKEGRHKMLVYELVKEGRSLNCSLFNAHDSGQLIDSSTRRAIALDTAKGLQHLHAAGVVHGGVKPENIMIDRAMQPKLVDYGLVALSTRFQSITAANSRGCRAYMAPEWVQSAPIGEKADVYSLGVVMLELVSGRRCLAPDAAPEERRFLPTWGFATLRRGGGGDPDSVLELVDPRLDPKALSGIQQQVLKGMAFAALWCVQEDPQLRPSMEQVVRMLEGDLTVNAPPQSPALDAFGRELCASQQQGAEQPAGFMQSPSLSENSEMRHR